MFLLLIFRSPTVHAAVATLLHEMKLVQRSNHNLEKEKNKLKSDLVRCRHVADV